MFSLGLPVDYFFEKLRDVREPIFSEEFRGILLKFEQV